jgi:hypothetical protein
MRQRSYRTRILTTSALCGALGVLSGYAVFLCYREVSENPSKERSFFIALLFTAVLSYIFEWLRDLIREGEVEHSRSIITRSLGTFVVVLVFEVFLAGFHSSVEQMNMDMLRRTAVALLDPTVEGHTANWILAVMAMGWVAVGAILAALLTKSVVVSVESLRRQVVESLLWGLFAGLIVAPAFVFCYVLTARSLVALENVAAYYAEQSLPFHLHLGTSPSIAATGGTPNRSATAPSKTLARNLAEVPLPETPDGTHSGGDALINIPPAAARFLHKSIAFLDRYSAIGKFIAQLPLRVSISLFLMALYVPFLLLILARKVSIWFFWLGFAAELALLIWEPFSSDKRSAEFNKWLQRIRMGILISTVGIFGYALFKALHPLPALMEAIAVAAISWSVPGILLGALAPLLRQSASQPRRWAFIGYGAALMSVLASLVMWRSQSPLPSDSSAAKVYLLAALAAAVVGLLFDRGMSVKEYWPLAALCVAVTMCGFTSVTVDLTLPGEVTLLDKIMQSDPPPSVQKEVRAHEIVDPAGYDEASARQLQVAIAGSVGFWITVGLLACWSIEEKN